MFVPCKSLQLGLIFVLSRAKEYLKSASLGYALALLDYFIPGWKSLPETNAQAYFGLLFNYEYISNTYTKSLYYKTFYDRN